MVKIKIVYLSEELRTGPEEREANAKEGPTRIDLLDPDTGEVLMTFERLKAEG